MPRVTPTVHLRLTSSPPSKATPLKSAGVAKEEGEDGGLDKAKVHMDPCCEFLK